MRAFENAGEARVSADGREGTGGRVALLVTVRWGDDVLVSKQLRGSEEAVIGAAPGALVAMPCASLGKASVCVARLRGGQGVALVPAGCVGSLRQVGEGGREGKGTVIGRARLLAGPTEVRLAGGEELTLWIEGFLVTVAAEGTERPVWAAAGGRRSLGALPYVAVAAAVHAGALGFAAHTGLTAGLVDEATPEAEVLRGYLAAAERKTQAADPVSQAEVGDSEGHRVNDRRGNGKAGGGARAAGEEGAMGSRLSRQSAPRRFALPKQAEGEAALSAARAVEEARDFGMIGLLATGGQHAPASAFGALEAQGADAIAADGGMWARVLGDRSGHEALGLSGVGLGGGGSGLGVGLERIGTVGHTSGLPGEYTGGGGVPLQGGGGRGWWSSWHGPRGYGRRARPPTIRWGLTQVTGRLPPEAIRRIIRQNFGRFRACYEDGLRRNPALAGRVTARFVIGRDGSVGAAQSNGSDLPDEAVVSCVVRAFYGISFPQPEGGIVTVVYPIVFSPAE
ncbi:AgmX/PglI C-terminal domain-containing protein [Chondromyces apiculatus]|uniref:AgmX/PglI C-terminal domain-containing protein n=1 Tax=Chondromyces apiculatus DSM 436 TaxID=1192034 RepID=A0A017T1P4_9BACT|nr:AgmX/PglI C-terminal domain-containing protein [Chondromyces apiculatus]EYF02770.1 Hypothetical protein CAP_6505 [Chondromyces apiculatus DSM 436]